MENKFVRQNILPVVAAMIWGTAFVMQGLCAPHIPASAFNSIRFFIAFVLLSGVCRVFDAAAVKKGRQPQKSDRRALVIGGICAGAFLTVASYLQQLGIAQTSAGKAGFITALYVVLVPVLGVFLKKRVTGQTWISVMIAVVGLYLLCIKAGEGFTLQTADIYLLFCAFFFAGQILTIDRVGARVDGMKFSCAQFLAAAVFSGIISLLTETVTWSGIMACVWPLLYCAVFSSCVAYTLQTLAQRDSDPTVVTLLLSLESVFSVIAGAAILGDRLSQREYLGCVLMLIAVLLAQAPVGEIKNRLKTRS